MIPRAVSASLASILVAAIGCHPRAPAAPPVTAPARAPVSPPPPAAPDAVAVAPGEVPDAVLDLDGDGRVDQVFHDPARVVRHSASGPLPEDLVVPSADQGNAVVGQVTLDGRPALVVEGNGREVDHDTPGRLRSYTWAGVGVFEFPAGAAARLGWEFRVETNRIAHDGWRVVATPDGSLLVTSNLGDDGVAGAAVTARLVRNGDGGFAQAGCWQAAPPSAPEPPCETAIRAPFHLRLTETMRPSENGSTYRAGTRVAVLQRGSLRRGSATLSCVRVLDDVGGVGWAFVTDAERARCAGARVAPAR
jgi:hypothetical protein